jgi:23S rRNA pseudouridine2605 synthase
VIRLQKYLAACGVASRREAERLIDQGRIKVNGVTATVGQSVDPETDHIEFDGARVLLEQHIYIVLNKPKGVVTTSKDTHDRRTVLDCLEGVSARVFPVGRLDLDTEGVLLLTNDGEFANRLLHPKYGVKKAYIAFVQGEMTEVSARHLAKGVELDDGLTAPCEVEILEHKRGGTVLSMTLHEGRKREVKRMCLAVGHPVRRLKRVSFAGIRVHGLRTGEWRYLTSEEVARLQKMIQA